MIEVKKSDLDQKRDETTRILEGLGLPEQEKATGINLISYEGMSHFEYFSAGTRETRLAKVDGHSFF